MGAVIVVLIGSIFMNFFVKKQDFYEPFVPDNDDGALGKRSSYETTTLFWMAIF